MLVRAQFRAEVTVQPWRPSFEMTPPPPGPARDAYAAMWIDGGFQPMYRRMFGEATVG